MKFAIVAGAIMLATSVSAAAESLPGVSDEETVIRSGQIRQFERGHGDVVFMRDREDKWYRVEMNSGCISDGVDPESMRIASRDVSGRIDKLSRVTFYQPTTRSCAINSIRRSEAPPQVNSKSIVTLD